MENSRAESLEKLKELTEGIDFCMLTTIDDGLLRSRPMSTQEFDGNGDLWFFTSDATHKVDEIAADGRVNVAYSNPAKSTYVSLSGRAEVVRDKAKSEELWSPILKAWFPEGLNDPSLVLLRVNIENAEYWETTSGTIVQLFGFVKALATGKSAEWGENRKIDL